MLGARGISPLSLLLILGIVIVLFGTQRLKNIGHDLGAAIKSFRKGIADEDTLPDAKEAKPEDKAL
jgi:sec-independent protein translocase protein TatA